MTSELTSDDLAELEERRTMVRHSRGRSAGLPKKWQGARWEELDAAETPARLAAVRAARRWAEDALGARGLFIAGPTGVGKTRIAATALVARLDIGPCRWLPVADLMMKLSRGFEDPERLRALDALDPNAGRAIILDDLDKVRPTEYQVAPLYNAVNGWVEHELPLVVTANKTLEELEELLPGHFGHAIASRLAEHCEVFELGGRDRRVNP